MESGKKYRTLEKEHKKMKAVYEHKTQVLHFSTFVLLSFAFDERAIRIKGSSLCILYVHMYRCLSIRR